VGIVQLGMTMSVDGFIADRSGDVNRLYPDLAELRKTDLLQESIRTTGAVLMGRHAYDMAQGDFTGYEFQVPIFVLTHHVPEKAAKGENGRLSFHFVTDGIKSALEKARAAAGDKNVVVIGGANTTQQCIRAELFDEIMVGIVPVLLGEGIRLFEYLGSQQIELIKTKVIESPGSIDILYRVVRDSGDSHEIS
jgi:dihydrofolate reductase